MGVYLHVITNTYPLGAMRAVDSTYPRHTHTGNQIYRRLDPNVAADFRPGGVREDLYHVVQRICNVTAPHSLDVLRICAHGSTDARQPAILLGSGLTASNVQAFESIRGLWRIAYETTVDPRQRPGDLNYRAVIPRIEMHICRAALRQEAPLQALANAARAPVFASYTLQSVSDPDRFVIEGALTRHEPVIDRSYRTSTTG